MTGRELTLRQRKTERWEYKEERYRLFILPLTLYEGIPNIVKMVAVMVVPLWRVSRAHLLVLWIFAADDCKDEVYGREHECWGHV